MPLPSEQSATRRMASEILEPGETKWHQIPDELQNHMVVPLTGGKTASPSLCDRKAALSTAHLSSLPANAAQLLSALGCLCIACANADSARTIPTSADPIIAALTCVPQLGTAVAANHLGQENFHALRHLLAYHVPVAQDSSPAWYVLKQCSIFETASNSMTQLNIGVLHLAPNAAWEQSMIDLLPQPSAWKMVKYHTASAIQRKLLKHSTLKVPDLPDFLDEHVLPNVDHRPDAKAEELLLQALDQLAGFPEYVPSALICLTVQGSSLLIGKLVDSSSNLLQTLFQNSIGMAIIPTADCRTCTIACIKHATYAIPP